MHSKKSRFRTLITLLIALIFVISSLQLVSADNSNMDLSQQPVKPVLPLTSSQELQLSIEQQYNDVVLSVISEHFGSLESLYEYGFFKIENNNDSFKYVFLFSKNNDITDHFIKAISSAVPIHLVKFKSVNKSHAELVKIQQEVDTTLFKSDLSNFISSYIDDDNQKIIVEVKNEEMAKYLVSTQSQNVEFVQTNMQAEPMLARDANFTTFNPCSNCEYDSTHSGLGPSIVGALVCKSGASSEVTCGTIEKIDASVTVGGVPLTNTVKFTKASLPYLGIGGDSGSIVFTAYNYGIIGPYSGGVNDSTGSSVAYTTKLVNFLADYGVTLYTSNTNKPVNPNK